MGKEASAKRHSGLNANAVSDANKDALAEDTAAIIEETAITSDSAAPEEMTAAVIVEEDLAIDWISISVKPGDTLSGLFEHYGLPSADWQRIAKLGDSIKPIYRMRPGDELRVRKTRDGRLAGLQIDLDEIRSLQITRTENGFETEILEAPVDRQHSYAIGTINSSLFMAAQNAGLDDSLAMELAFIFGWDIDFALDIRSGDRFLVIYEEIFRHGEKIGNGDIVAAEFVNQGRKLQAFRYTTPDGRSQFYSADGKSMRKAFLRTPVDFARISSKFNLGRRHPILNRIRAHKGVDYAAANGTPIKAAGNGRVEFKGRKGGYGNTIIIKHGSSTSTLYAHMSRFGRGISNGSRVQQGQIIGYVGSSGLATGPHLHYEFRVNGAHKNPLTVKLPTAEPLAKEYKEDFRSSITPALAQLETLNQIRTAANTR
jgi:murein DD-endopeptidase MepM/ murein hydrolase activator NlpD